MWIASRILQSKNFERRPWSVAFWNISSSAVHFARRDANLRRQRAVNRTLICDLHKFPTLLWIERSFHRDIALDLVEHAGFGFALGAILGMNLAVSQYHGHAIKRQRLSVGIHSHGHGG